MSQLLGFIHGREETFPPALIAEINRRQTGLIAESIELSGVEALERSPYRALVDRLAARVGYFRSFLHQQSRLGVPCFPDPSLQLLDRVGLAQLALKARVHYPPTQLLPHQIHPPGVESEDLGNLAYPLPWERYLERVDLPGRLRPLRLGPGGSSRSFSTLSELWQAYGHTGHDLHVMQPDLDGAQHLIVLVAGGLLEVVGYEPISGRYRVPSLDSRWIEAARSAITRLQEHADLFLTGLEFCVQGERLWLVDFHLYPDLEWWSLGEDAFTRVVDACAQEILDRLSKRTPKPKKTRTV